ncbi:MAG: sigma factor-binding protein Crl [Enterovibrio sp.]
MAEATKTLSHNRLLTRFAQLGPYLRRDLCTTESYFFDCLSVCVNDKKSPETREFWGWWLELAPTETGFSYTYHYGKFNTAGDWVADAKHKESLAHINDTLNDFYKKLASFVVDELSLTLMASEKLTNAKLAVQA